MTVSLTTAPSRSDPGDVLVLIEADDRDRLLEALRLVSGQHVVTRYTEPEALPGGGWVTLAACSPP